MAYTVHQAKTHFSRLLKEAEAGREVLVMRGKKPVAKIVAAESTFSRKSLAGAYAKEAHWDDDAFDPMTDEELIQSGLGYLLDAPLVAPGPGAAQADKAAGK
jgi:prevent-host-death family protein